MAESKPTPSEPSANSSVNPTTAAASQPRTAAEAKPAPRPATSWSAWLALALLAGMFAWIFAPALVVLRQWWDTDPNYSHGYIVPVVSLFFGWRAWKKHGLPWRESVGSGWLAVGVLGLALGMGLHASAWFADFLLLDVVSMVALGMSTLLLLGGPFALRHFGFSVFFLIFMAPLPPEWYQPLAISMQGLVSNISTTVLEVCGVPVYRQGNVIQMSDYSMEVGAACSGLRQILAFFALTSAAAYMSGRRLWYQLSLVALSVPIAIGANCLRVTVTGFIMMAFGPKWAKGFFHTLEGLAIMLVGMGLVLVTSWCLGKLDDRLGSSKVSG